MNKALVLGSGGLVGMAWELGLVAGLSSAGVDLLGADRILGSSAGAIVGAHLASGVDAETWLESLLLGSSEAAPSSPAALPDLTRFRQLRAETVLGDRDPVEVRRDLGAFALSSPTIDEPAYLAIVDEWLTKVPPGPWPDRRYACTAVDAESGEPQLWTSDSGVDLTRAVASSCSIPGLYPAIGVGGRRYIDGGIRSSTNADLATGYERVAVVRIHSATTLGSMAEAFAKQFERELEILRHSGSRVVAIGPDEASRAAMGSHLMDLRQRPGAARAGLSQGKAEAEALLDLWG